MRKFLLTILCTLLGVSAFAQMGGMKGVVVSRDGREPISGVALAIDGVAINTTTNEDGEFIIEGLTCHYAGVPNQDGVTNPGLKSGSYENIYPSWLYSDPRPTVSKGWYQWAFKEEITGRSLYGSVLFTYNTNATVCSENGVYALRSSGYSRFARRNVCKDGEKATITAIYGIYAQKSTYAGNADDYASYQLTVSNFSDIEFENGDAAFLTDEQVAAMTTEDMKTVPWIDEEGESEYN